MSNLRGFWHRKCSTCNELKPARTHHCSVCDTCVFQMSHHCPFTNNCVGLENQRFFLLFIFYSLLGCLYYVITIMTVWNNHLYYENKDLMTFLLIFDNCSVICLFIINVWSWFLAAAGLTTIEFISRQIGFKANYYDFSFMHADDNLFKIFGTKSII